jgi:tetratricopeptide (TPR) repeat protein
MKEKDLELIQKFLENELSEQEAELFKSLYEHDEEFKKEVNLRSGIYISLAAASRTSLKALAEDPAKRRSPQSHLGQPAPVGRNLRMYLQYAAFVLIMAALGTIIFLIVKPKTGPEELYASYYKSPDTKTIPKPRSGLDLTDFSFLLEKLDRGNAMATDTLQSPEEFFYFGIYCMNQERFTEAIYAFSELIKTNDRYYKDGSEWYLALCYMRTGKIEEAIRAFTAIASTKGHEYQEESRELLSKLK